MFAKLFGRSDGPVRRAEAPVGTRLYVVGDIHGRADLLDRMHQLILDDAAGAAAARKVVIYLGDYVDRGLESRQVIERLIGDAPAGFERVRLRGNHEELMLRFLDDPETGPEWFFNGGDATLFSYGVKPNNPLVSGMAAAALRHQLVARLPEPHLALLRSLGLYHVERDYLFVHAGIRPGVPIEDQLELDLTWIRDDFLDSRADHGKVVVHGHTITGEPEFRANRIGIDTGAFLSGRLTCLVLDGATRRILQT